MAEAIDLELFASAAVTSDSAGSAVEIEGLQRLAQVRVSVSAYSASAAGSYVRVYLERRDSTAEPWVANELSTADDGTVTRYLAFTEAGAQDVGIELGVFNRVRFDVNNLTTATVNVAGTAHVAYALPSELGNVLISRAIQEVTLTQRVQACLAASDEADSYLALGYVLPITAWDQILKTKVAWLACANALSIRGADIHGPDKMVYDERDRARSWFNLLAAGRVKPRITDSTPEVYDQGMAIASRTPRWCRR